MLSASKTEMFFMFNSSPFYIVFFIFYFLASPPLFNKKSLFCGPLSDNFRFILSLFFIKNNSIMIRFKIIFVGIAES
jgi:hypothetical protein